MIPFLKEITELYNFLTNPVNLCHSIVLPKFSYISMAAVSLKQKHPQYTFKNAF